MRFSSELLQRETINKRFTDECNIKIIKQVS